MKRLKIIFSEYDDINNPYYGGGGAFAVHEIAKRFAKNANVSVVNGNYNGAKDGKIDGVNYKRIGLSFAGPKIGQLIFHFILPFMVKKIEHDIWIESFTPPISTSFIPLFTNKPVIGLVHMLSGTDMRRKYRLPFDWLESIGLKKYKYFIVMNEADKEYILKINRRARVEVIGNGVDLPGRVGRVELQHILYLGRIEVNQKGLDLLIKAYSDKKDKIKIPLFIAGSGSEKEITVLQRLIDRYGLGEKVKLAGKVEGKQKADLLKKSLFVVVPSRQESFSITALEAISFGKPVISFDISGLSWLPRSCRLVSKREDTKIFGNLMHKLYSNKSLRKSMSKSALEFSKKFSWEKKFVSYYEFITKVLSG